MAWRRSRRSTTSWRTSLRSSFSARKRKTTRTSPRCNARVSLSRGLAAARLFFGKAFQPSESLKALAYFKDGDLPQLSRNDRRTLIEAAAAVGELPRVALRSRELAIAL